MIKTRAMELAVAFADAVETKYGANARVRNAAEARDHGYVSGALATVSYEGLGDLMIEMTMETYWTERAARAGCFLEPYAGWLIAVYPVRK